MQVEAEVKSESEESVDKLTTSKLAQKLGTKTNDLLEQLVAIGYLDARDGKHYITTKGKDAGGEFRMSQKYGPYFIWPESLKL